MANTGDFKGYGKGFKVGDNSIQRLPRPRLVLKVTRKMVAAARGCHADTVRRHEQSGRVDMADLASVSRYVMGIIDSMLPSEELANSTCGSLDKRRGVDNAGVTHGGLYQPQGRD